MDSKMMRRAMELAQRGIGKVNPNPLVGAVIVKDGEIVGEGWHDEYGGPHAEVNAIRTANVDLRGATMYVTLEPCSHFGKTPPCADLIVKNGFGRVVVGMIDPNPLVAGRGIEIMRKAGIEVVTGVLEEPLMEMNRAFVHYIKTKRPYVTLKTAMTLDGKIATETGDSKWISCEQSRERVHRMRHEMMGIMVGVGTVLADNPRLTTRLPEGKGRDPIRIIVDSTGSTPLSSSVVSQAGDGKTIIATTSRMPSGHRRALEISGVIVLITKEIDGRVDLEDLMKLLGERGIDSVLLEGGATLNWSALRYGIVQEVISFISPKILGGKKALTPVGGSGYEKVSEALVFNRMSVETVGSDLMIRARMGGE